MACVVQSCPLSDCVLKLAANVGSFGWWCQYGVDHVNHPVGRIQIRHHQLSVIDFRAIATDSDHDRCALNCLRCFGRDRIL